MNVAELKARADIVQVAEALGCRVRGRRCNAPWRDGKSMSVALDLERGLYFDHVSGEGGDVIALIEVAKGADFREAVTWLSDSVGQTQFFAPKVPAGTPRPTEQHHEADASKLERRIARALQIWNDAQPLPTTLGGAYLGRRRLASTGLEHVLRFHSRCFFGSDRLPCMVALLRDVEADEPCGIHRTALDATGSKIGRKMLGRASQAAIKLVNDEDVLDGLGVAEGIETALSVGQAGWTPVWALLSAGGVKALPLLEGIESLTVWADHDSTGLSAARSTAKRWAGAGREAVVRYPAPDGRDFNDSAIEAIDV